MKSLKQATRNGLLTVFRQDTISYFYAYFNYYIGCTIDILRSIKGSIPIFKQSGTQKGMPKVLQFPITNHCNLKCKTCNVPNIREKDITLSQLNKIINDKLFAEIVAVGINGGEPFLINNIVDFVLALVKLPKIKNINIISNGTLTERILSNLKEIYSICKSKNVKLGFTVSIDGYRDIHDEIRGVEGAFDNTVNTYKAIKENMNSYCDNLGVICTISRYNIFYINDLLAFAELNNITNISFQLAVEHNRLSNYNIPSFSVLDDEYTKMLAEEFFYTQFLQTRKRTYYFIYEYLKYNGHKRMSTCPWADRDVTIDASGNLRYCATNSKKIGHVDDDSLYADFLNYENISYRKELVKSKCDSCVHYSSPDGYLDANIQYRKVIRDNSSWFHNYLSKGKKYV